jgi:hypothetical protein
MTCATQLTYLGVRISSATASLDWGVSVHHNVWPAVRRPEFVSSNLRPEA